MADTSNMKIISGSASTTYSLSGKAIKHEFGQCYLLRAKLAFLQVIAGLGIQDNPGHIIGAVVDEIVRNLVLRRPDASIILNVAVVLEENEGFNSGEFIRRSNQIEIPSFVCRGGV
jgi:hypothetical protein